MNKNIVITILSILLVITAGYLIYDKIVLEQKENETPVENNQNLEENDESNLLDLSQLSEYKNYTGTYGDLKDFYADNYSITLSLDGKVRVCNSGDCHSITNIENVVDMIKLSVPGEPAEQQFYFLLDNGDVYNYKIGDVDKNIFTATKVETVSNIKKIINYSYAELENAVGTWGIIAITKDNEYIKIFESIA